MDTFLIMVGLLGVAMSLGAYALLTRRVFTNKDPRYYVLNIVATSCIGLSLIAEWNLAAFVSQVLWIGLSIIGLVRVLRSRA